MALHPYPAGPSSGRRSCHQEDPGRRAGPAGRSFMADPAELTCLPLSRGRPLSPLVESIRTLGLLRPLWVAMLGDRPVVVSGGRRLAALRLLKAGPVAVWAPEAAEPAGLSPSARILLASVTDDLERGFNPAELTQIWRLTREETPEEDRPAIARLLGFEPRGRKALALERSALLPDRGLDMMALGRLDPENSLILAGWERPEIDQALDLFDRAWPSRQNRRLWLEWLDDLRRSEGPAALSGLLASPELAGLSGPGAEKAARDHIRALRFPRLTELGHRRREALKALDLPKGLKLGLDPDFEDVTATVSLTFSDAPELRRLATSAMELADQGTLDRLWALEDRSR